MVDTPQKIYVHGCDTLENGEKIVLLNTRGETPPSSRTEIKDNLSKNGIKVDEMEDEVGNNIGIVHFDKNDDVESVGVEDWVEEQYGE